MNIMAGMIPANNPEIRNTFGVFLDRLFKSPFKPEAISWPITE